MTNALRERGLTGYDAQARPVVEALVQREVEISDKLYEAAVGGTWTGPKSGAPAGGRAGDVPVEPQPTVSRALTPIGSPRWSVRSQR